jgi:hypothetical protein
VSSSDLTILLVEVLAGFSIGVAVRVVPELREHPSAEDHTESGQTAQDFGVRVLFKRRRQLSFERAGLADPARW